MKLSDTVIGHVAQLVQIAILTGTDVVDHMRMMVLVDDGEGLLELDPDYEAMNDENVQRMIEEAVRQQEALSESNES